MIRVVPNDRLLLGMKGSISEFELSVIRSRMLDAKHGKALRGELRISVPLGYIWHREIGLGFDPDLRVQEAIRVIFARFREHGSARQVLLSLAAEQMHFPRPSNGKKLVSVEWTPIRYRSVISILKNPFYAGAYAYGKSQKRTALIEGRARTTYKHRKPIDQWGSYHQRTPRRLHRLERVRTQSKDTRGERLREGRRSQVRTRWSLLATWTSNVRTLWPSTEGGLLRSGSRSAGVPLRATQPAVSVAQDVLSSEQSAWMLPLHASCCVLWSRWLLKQHLKPSAGIWSYKASDDTSWSWNCSRRATRPRLPNDATPPAILIIGLSLRSLKNTGKRHCSVYKAVRRDWPHFETPSSTTAIPNFVGLAEDLEAAWNARGVTMRSRQQLLRAMIVEIIADYDPSLREIVLKIHWRGGQHSELRVLKPKSREHGCRTNDEAIALISTMATRWSDEDIAATLNRMRLPTGQGKTWTANRVSSLRRVRGIHAYRSAEKNGEWLTMSEAAVRLGVSNHQIRRLIKQGILAADQVVPDAPYQIRAKKKYDLLVECFTHFERYQEFCVRG